MSAGTIIFWAIIIINIVIQVTKKKTREQEQQIKTNQNFQEPIRQATIKQEPIKQEPIRQAPLPVVQKTLEKVQPQKNKTTTSTTEYLEQKATAERNEHTREENQRLIRENQLSAGGVAERLLYGESVPNGKQLIVCSYCAAENLLPYNTREAYTCYFCREAL